MAMVDGPTVHKTLSCAVQATRIGIRCLASPRDSQEASQRAVLLLVDILDLLYQVKDQVPDAWVTGKNDFLHKQETHAKGLRETLKWYESTLKTIETYFQPGGVCVCYFRKYLLEKTFLPQLEQYKIAFLLWIQPESCERSYIDCEIKDHLKRWQELETANSQLNLEFEEDVRGLTSRLASEHFITLADLCNRRQQGSCRWIFEESEYKQWLLGGFKTLYCVGPAGAGKTFLSSVIIDSLQRTFTSPDIATVFIFCQEEKENEQESIDLLQNILAQLVYRKRSLSYATSSLYYSESLTGVRASTKVYHNAIRAEVNLYSKVFFVVDGLDIFSDKERILSRLQKLPAHCQLLVTLREAPVAGNSSYVDVRTSVDDLRCYTLSHFHSDANSRNILQDNGSLNYELLCEIVRILMEKSNGVFLLAKIHLELLSKYTDRSLLERALHHLPQSLNEAYGEAMKQVLSTNPRAKRHVYWTLYAFRPLSVAELQDATKTAEPEDRQEEMTFEQHLQIQTAGFLTVDAVTGTVRFIHKTVKEYLEGAVARVFFPDAKKDIAEACLTAIASDEAIDDCYVSNRTSRNRSNGFLSYAATYWGYHAREVPEEEQTIQVLIKAFLNKLQWRRPPQDCVETKEMPSELGLGKYPEDWSALHILAFFGIRSKSKRLLEQGAKANTNDNSLKATPLHCAAARGNDEMVEFLLDSGVNSNAVANDGSTALHMATQHGHRKAMKLLLCQPVNAQISNHKGSRSLHLAVETAACEATVPLLVKHKAGVDSRNPRTGDTALHLAVEWRRPRVILFLLEQGAAVDMSNEDGLTPLQLAVKTDNCEAISILLQRGAHVDARSFSGLTALQIAAQRKHWIAFDLLVIGGANLDTWNHNGETLLHEQARNSFSSTSIAAKLLKQGANIEARSPQGYTALQYAAMSGNKMMFMHLLSQGAKIDVLTPKGESLLHITPPLNNDCLDILRPLLNRNLKTNIVSSEGWMPLHKIVYMGTGAMDLESDKTREFIELLLSHGADINAYTTTAIAETPLHLATRASPCRPQLISFLVGLGADINALTNEGKTPLHLAGERGRESIFRILLGAGADFYLEIPDTMSPIPETQKTTPMEESATSAGSTAFDLARKNPFSVLWLDDEGKLCPAPERKRRDSVGTVIEEELEPEDLDDDMTESTLVGSERQLVLV